MGRKLKKYRSVSKGLKNATPKPPVVMASSTPCEAVARNNNSHSRPFGGPACRRWISPAKPTAVEATTAAASIEWLRPRCPHRLAYGT